MTLAPLQQPPPQARPRRGAARQSLLVVGNGLAGHKLCDRLVALGGTRRYAITVLGQEPRPAYDRIRLTRVLEGTPPEQLALAGPTWHADHGITLITGTAAVSVDPATRTVRTRSGQRFTYDRLVLATGSRAHRPDLPGADLPGVFVYRDLEDLQALKTKATSCRRAAVLGGGLLGLEVAQALKTMGLNTWIVERGVGLLTRQLDPQGSRLLESHVHKLGIHICVSRQTESIQALGNDLLLQFNSGECLRVQLVVFATGIRPRDELAGPAGLKMGPRGGFAVDDRLATSDPHIFAVGECASHRGTLYGLAAPACQMADALALSLMGRKSRFTEGDVSTWLKLPGIQVATLGEFQNGTDELVAHPPGKYRRLVFHNRRLVGAIAIGEWPEYPRVQELVHRQARLWGWQENRFRHTGALWRESAVRPVQDWPASALVCNCVGVRRGQLSRHCQEGCATVEQLAAITGASSICGSCKPLLAQLVGAPPVSAALPGTRGLLAASLLALLLAGGVSALNPIPFSSTVQEGWHWDQLWRDGFWKKTSGFSLLGLSVLSLGLSLRKRIPRIQWGAVGMWRAFHAGLGVLMLLLLITHTGFRLGKNLNFVLMIDFLALAALGAMAGGINALDSRFGGPAARRLRAVWTGAHVALVWPLPVLIVAHVLMAYWF